MSAYNAGMKKAALFFLIATILLPLLGQSAMADDTQTLTGEYLWTNRDSRGDLKAVFTPTGTDGIWDVTFYFNFRGEPHEYAGSAEGSLSEGALKGVVKNEDKKRTFTFEGEFEDGTFRGTHEETTPSRARRTGTLTLSG